MKTQLKELATVGWRPIALMLGETAFLALLVLVLLNPGWSRAEANLRSVWRPAESCGPEKQRNEQ